MYASGMKLCEQQGRKRENKEKTTDGQRKVSGRSYKNGALRCTTEEEPSPQSFLLPPLFFLALFVLKLSSSHALPLQTSFRFLSILLSISTFPLIFLSLFV